jgi:hypothetical protein
MQIPEKMICEKNSVSSGLYDFLQVLFVTGTSNFEFRMCLKEECVTEKFTD